MAAPTITSVNPNQGPSSGGTTVTITGTNFIGSNLVAFGDSSASFTVNSPTSITSFSPPNSAGTVDVRVTNPDGTSPPNTGDLFFYTASPPTVTGVSPTQGPTAGGTTVTITGTNFLSASSVTFGGTSATFTINSDTQITAFSPPGAAGTVDVQVTNRDGTSAPSPADRFTYQPAPATVTAVNPNTGSAAGGTTVTITGTNFLRASAVTFGAAPAPAPQPPPQNKAASQAAPGALSAAAGSASTTTSFVVNSANQITAFSPPGAVGAVHVRVTTPDGTSAPTAADQLTYQ